MSTFGRLMLGGLGAMREEKEELGTRFIISFPADLILHMEDVFDKKRNRIRRVSAEPLRREASSDNWPRPEGGELEFSLYRFDSTSDLLKPRPRGRRTEINMNAVKTMGMREHWGGNPSRKAEVILSDLGRESGFPPFWVSHGASSTTVAAHLRDPKRAQEEFQVWLDLLEERGAIVADAVDPTPAKTAAKKKRAAAAKKYSAEWYKRNR